MTPSYKTHSSLLCRYFISIVKITENSTGFPQSSTLTLNIVSTIQNKEACPIQKQMGTIYSFFIVHIIQTNGFYIYNIRCQYRSFKMITFYKNKCNIIHIRIWGQYLLEVSSILIMHYS